MMKTEHEVTLSEDGLETVELFRDVDRGEWTLLAEGCVLCKGEEWVDADGQHRVAVAHFHPGVDLNAVKALLGESQPFGLPTYF